MSSDAERRLALSANVYTLAAATQDAWIALAAAFRLTLPMEEFEATLKRYLDAHVAQSAAIARYLAMLREHSQRHCD